MQINKNTIIKCNNLNEVKDCLDKLEELGFKVFFFNDKEQLIISKLKNNNEFKNYVWVDFCKENFCVTYKFFLKLYNKQIKEKEPDLLEEKNERILKINNFNSNKKIFFYDVLTDNIHRTVSIDKISKTELQKFLIKTDCYTSKEACEKAVKRKEIENKLKLLAFELNGNKNITEEEWKNSFIKKCYLYYNYYNNTIRTGDDSVDMNQGTIYCLSKDFKDKAIELIGKKDLEEYLING